MTTIINDLIELNDVLDRVSDVVRNADYEADLERFQPDIARQHGEMFAGEFDSNLLDWAELRPSTIQRKGHDRILFETGALMNSLVEVGGPGNVHATSPRGLIFGTEVEYAQYHQEGTQRMVARPPVGLTEETVDNLANHVAQATVRKLEEGR